MLSSLLGKVKNLALGNDDPEPLDEARAAEEEEDEIEIPMVKTGISTNRSAPRSVSSEVQNRDEGQDQPKKVKGIGTITTIDFSLYVGVIDKTYQFNTEKFCSNNQNFHKGNKVEYEAENILDDKGNIVWNVTSLKLFVSDSEKVAKETSRFRNAVAQVKSACRDYVEVEAGKDNKNPRTFRIPYRRDLDVGFFWKPGDWMRICLENLPSDNVEDDDFPANITISRIKSVAPLNRRTLVGKVTRRFNNFLIDDTVYFSEDVCEHRGQPYPLGTAVRCIAIQSTQYIDHKDFVSWRAIEVKKSNFLHYTGVDANDDGEGNWRIDDSERFAIDNYNQLLKDKFGIKILPRFYLNFPPLLIGSSTVKTLTVVNEGPDEHRLRRIVLNQENDAGQFKVRAVEQEDDGALTFCPGDEVKFEVTCRPTMIGKTKEICVFDFGDFLIGRELSATGRSDEEQHLRGENTGSQRHTFKKQIGEHDISKIITDRDRRRVRGSHNVRAPYFSQKRLPLNKVPNELYQILKQQDETRLKALYPHALLPLQYDNYLEKFRVSLWFEEIENDLRRRQYDMKNVRLIRHNRSPVYYTFHCPGLLDFQPPVNLQDTVDVFDEDSADNAKFQGTITKMDDNEVSCVFGDAFNQKYTGFPLTIQFNLGRTNYKRCHFAVQTAIEHLGREFLFPEGEISLKNPRILSFEDGDDAEVAEAQNVPVNAVQVRTESTIFHKAPPSKVFRPGSVSNASSMVSQSAPSSSAGEGAGRRVPSHRSRFVSNTVAVQTITNVKLEWFNTNLNQEQKNAVRRILRGQARPLPYVIFGPPGTGKTVTLVEAIMQVNKLDPNSRILVCAPSNAAADVIAEYLANSHQYHPGDFIRLNGFLRAGQAMLDAVSPFCADGDDLHNVAMHRLIISTCMTAGQFFSLDLSLGHFTHVFIDEAGYCTEPEAMVPTILLAKCKGGQLILAGDPNQLGPVLMSDVSQNCGLNRSFLERLMSRKLYMRDPDSFKVEKYNPFVLTKLVKNYRAHPMLLSLPSRMFYDDDLISFASQEDAFSLIQNEKVKELLVSEGVPLIFEGVQGTCTRERDSPSWCNIQEAMKVAHYVCALVKKCGLTNDDIGVITPYRKQVEKIRTALQLNLKEVDIPKVASVEEFQGGERKVIIISTVRSVNEEKVDNFLDRLAFLYQPKRFNVVITRAKALMIIVGNPHVLARNTHWVQLLKYAIELNAYTGCNLPVFLNQKVAKLAVVNQVKENGVNNGGMVLSTGEPAANVVEERTADDTHDEFQECQDNLT